MLGDVEHEPLPVAGSAHLILYQDRLVTHPLCTPVAMDHTVLRREDLARLSGPLILSLQPLAIFGVHHTPPESWVLAFLGRVTRQGLYLRAHVNCGVGAADLLDVNNRRALLDQGAVSLLGFPQLTFRLFSLGYVARGDHHTTHARVVEHVVYDVLEVAPRAVLVRHSKLQWWVKPWLFQELGERVQRLLPVIRMNGAECADPYLLFGAVARYPLDCRAYVADCTVGLEKCDDVGGVL